MIKNILLMMVLLVSTLQAKENQWLRSVVGLIPYGWELNKTTCKKIKRKLPIYKKESKVYKYGTGDNLIVRCSVKEKKLIRAELYNNKYFKQVGLDMDKGDLFLQSSKYYNKNEDDLILKKHDDGEIYGHKLYYGENTIITICDDCIRIEFDDSDF
jgi:hypothetical protein